MTIYEQFRQGDILTVGTTGANTGSSGLNFITAQVNDNENNIGSAWSMLSALGLSGTGGAGLPTGPSAGSGGNLLRLVYQQQVFVSGLSTAGSKFIGSYTFANNELKIFDQLHVYLTLTASGDKGVGQQINSYIDMCASGVGFFLDFDTTIVELTDVERNPRGCSMDITQTTLNGGSDIAIVGTISRGATSINAVCLAISAHANITHEMIIYFNESR